MNWKNFERSVAKWFGAKRNPLSGINSGHTGSDTLHPKFYIECKKRKSFSLWTLFEDTREKAKKEKKIPVIALSQNSKHGFLLVLHSSDVFFDEGKMKFKE